MLRTNTQLLGFIESQFANQTDLSPIKKMEISKGDTLLEQSKHSYYVYIVQSGIVKVFFSEENGKDYIFEFLGKGQIIGEIEAIKQIQCLCSIQAIVTSTVFAIPKALFSKLIKTNSTFNQLIIEELAERIINTSTRASLQQLYTIEYTLLHLIELYEEENLSLTKQDLADYLGITIRSLNRTIKGIKDKLQEGKTIEHFNTLFHSKTLSTLSKFS